MPYHKGCKLNSQPVKCPLCQNLLELDTDKTSPRALMCASQCIELDQSHYMFLDFGNFYEEIAIIGNYKVSLSAGRTVRPRTLIESWDIRSNPIYTRVSRYDRLLPFELDNDYIIKYMNYSVLS